MNSARLRCNPIHLPGKQYAFLIRRDGGRADAYSAGGRVPWNAYGVEPHPGLSSHNAVSRERSLAAPKSSPFSE